MTSPHRHRCILSADSSTTFIKAAADVSSFLGEKAAGKEIKPSAELSQQKKQECKTTAPLSPSVRSAQGDIPPKPCDSLGRLTRNPESEQRHRKTKMTPQ